MDSYWRDDLSQAKRAAILADWCDELEDWPVESIKGALRQHRREFPSKKPNPGHIDQRLAKAWGERNAEAVRAAATPRYQRVDRGPVERRMAVADELSERFPDLVKRIDRRRIGPARSRSSVTSRSCTATNVDRMAGKPAFAH